MFKKVKVKVLRIVDNKNNNKIDNKEDNVLLEKRYSCKNDINLQISYKDDPICQQLYRYIIKFIKENKIKDLERSTNVKKILFDIENVFKKYGF